MSAKDHIQPYQMKLFYDAHDLMNMRAGDDEEWDQYDTLSPYNQPRMLKDNPELVQEKRTESKEQSYFDDDTNTFSEGSLEQSIRNEGVKHPVSIAFLPTNEPVIWNGHHRIVVAHDIDPDMYVPHTYIKNGPTGQSWTSSYAEKLKKSR